MIDFVLATNNPAKVKDLLVNRGIINDDFSGVRNGFEYTVEGIPNPIMTALGSGGRVTDPGYVPPTYNSMRVYLVRFSHETEADEIADDATQADNFTKSKLVKWVKANGTPVTIDSVDGWSVGTWRVKITGTNVFLTNDLERMGVWQ